MVFNKATFVTGLMPQNVDESNSWTLILIAIPMLFFSLQPVWKRAKNRWRDQGLSAVSWHLQMWITLSVSSGIVF